MSAEQSDQDQTVEVEYMETSTGTEEDSTQNFEFNCEICNRKFFTLKGLKLHGKFKHSLAFNQNEIECKYCGKIFNCLRNFTIHEKTHLPIEERQMHSCPYCDKKFLAMQYVREHIRVIHEKVLSFICELCGKGFGNKNALISHKFVHSTEKPIECTKCTSTFKNKRALKLHLETHSDTKYECPECGLHLNTRKILRNHMIIHSDEKKFNCNHCGKKFKRLRALQNHLISHSGLKPYKCPFCTRFYSNGSNCRKHQKKMHPLKLEKMENNGEKCVYKDVSVILSKLKSCNLSAN